MISDPTELAKVSHKMRVKLSALMQFCKERGVVLCGMTSEDGTPSIYLREACDSTPCMGVVFSFIDGSAVNRPSFDGADSFLCLHNFDVMTREMETP